MSRPEITLEEYANKLYQRVGNKYKALRELWKDIRNGVIRIEDPTPPVTFASYVFRLDYSLWLWAGLALVILTSIIVLIADYTELLRPIRYVLGTIYILFMPGYSLVEVLYPQDRDLTPLERISLSIGLSLAVVPLVGLALNYTPWGIRLVPIVLSISLFTSLLLCLAAYRKYMLFKLANLKQQRRRERQRG